MRSCAGAGARQRQPRQRGGQQRPDHGASSSFGAAAASSPALKYSASAKPRARRHHQVGEALHAVVELAHGAVVEAARVLQVVLDVHQVALQGQEILAGLELGVGLLDHQQAGHVAFDRLLEAGQARRRRGGHGLRPQFGHALEHGLLVAGVGAHGLHQARHQVVPAHQLHVDVAPAGLHLVAQPHQAVEGEYGPGQARPAADQ